MLCIHKWCTLPVRLVGGADAPGQGVSLILAKKKKRKIDRKVEGHADYAAEKDRESIA